MSDLTSTSFNASSPAMAAEIMQRIRAEIQKVIMGQESVIDQILMALMASGHVLIEGVPGLGKTLLVKVLAKTFKGDYGRIQFTPDLMPADVTGHVIYNMHSENFTLRKGPIFNHLLLADEINRAPAKTQSALLEVMQEQQVTMEGQSLAVPRPFMTLATQNPIEHEGTYPLPEAQLDRFLFKVVMDYPSLADEQDMVRRLTSPDSDDAIDLGDIRPVIRAETLSLVQRICAGLRVDRGVSDYAVNLVRATRETPGISIGAGPRGAIALVKAAQAHAILNTREYTRPDDVKAVVLPALRHRIRLSPELELDGQTSDDVLRQLLTRVKAPRA